MSDTVYAEGGWGGSFLVEVDGTPIGTFKEITGLSVDIGVEEVEEGGQNGFVHKLPGRMTWPNLVLKRGVTSSNTLFAWINKISGDGFTGQQNKVTRSTLAIVLVGADGTSRLRSWNFEGAFPVKWSGPSFSATSTEPAEEELEIAHHGFTIS